MIAAIDWSADTTWGLIAIGLASLIVIVTILAKVAAELGK